MTDEDTRAGEIQNDPLDVLACDYQRRPKGAPSFFDLEDSIRSVRREDGSLLIDFDPAEVERVTSLVEAERLCCATIGWELRMTSTLQVRISASDPQLQVFEQFLPHRS